MLNTPLKGVPATIKNNADKTFATIFAQKYPSIPIFNGTRNIKLHIHSSNVYKILSIANSLFLSYIFRLMANISR